MSHYMVFLNNGETVHIWAADFEWTESRKMLKFIKNLRNIALFNTDNICGFMCCDKDGDVDD